MKCFVCDNQIPDDESLNEHVTKDINDKKYGMRADLLASILIDLNTRIAALEPTTKKTEKKPSYKPTAAEIARV
jgi:hypothetical protein